uniref:Uncharacterized protein n=1 Tax=Paraburkholderia sprentiae WSM5005 TaxID=754502 RepID=A0A1I9YEJ9_9BURK
MRTGNSELEQDQRAARAASGQSRRLRESRAWRAVLAFVQTVARGRDDHWTRAREDVVDKGQRKDPLD